MPDTQQNVNYSYTGDVSSLRKATEEAIGLLDRYSREFRIANTAGNFGASEKSAKSMRWALNELSKDLENLQKKMKDVSDVSLNSKGSVSSGVSSLVQNLKDQYQRYQDALGSVLGSTGNPTVAPERLFSTEEVNSFAAQIRDARKELDSLSSGIDSSIATEQKFQNSLNATAIRVSSFRDTLDSVKSRVSGIFEPITEKIKTMSSVFDPVNAKLQSFRDRASEAFQRVNIFASTVAQAFRRTSQEADGVDGSTQRISASSSFFRDILQKLASSISKETQEIEEEEEELDKKNKKLDTSRNKHNSLSSAISNLAKTIKSEVQHLRNLTNGFKNFSGVVDTAKRAFESLTGIKLGEWLAEATKKSIEYTENLNLFKVALGDAYEQGEEFVKLMQEFYGMDPSNIMRYTGYFYQLADAISMPAEASANLSLGLTKAANDIGSLFNVDIETVVNDLASGMQGMSRAVRKYGMDIRTTTLQQTALSLGISEQVTNMSEANRQGLRFITMMRQAQNASGDFAKTIETPANQLRIFKEQMAQLGRAIGNMFIVPLRSAIQYVNGFVMALRVVLTYIGTLLGWDTEIESVATAAEDLSESVSGIGDSAEKTAKKLKNLIAPFDEITILSQKDTGGDSGTGLDIGTLDPAIEAEIEKMKWSLEEVRMKANEVRDALLQFLGFKVDMGEIISWDPAIFEANLIAKFPQWTQTIRAAFSSWSGVVDGFKAVVESLSSVFDALKQRIVDTLGGKNIDSAFAEFISSLPEKLQNIAKWIDTNADSIARWIETLVLLGAAFKVFSALAPIISVIGSFIRIGTAVAQVIGAITEAVGGLSAAAVGWIAIIALVIATLVDLWNTDEEFRTTVTEAWNALVEFFRTLWNSLLKPIIDSVIKVVKEIYEKTIKPIVKQIVEIISVLWSDVLEPLFSWIIKTFGPNIVSIVDTILSVVQWLFQVLGGLISGLLTVLRGVIEFIAGVFSGDWERAWKGIVLIFKGIINTIASIFVAVLNVVITVINAAISVIWNGIQALVNALLSSVEWVLDKFGVSFTIRWASPPPQIPYVKAPMPAMANGGVVTGPTTALIGEGTHDEAVIPLGNSPQMRDFADSVAQRVNSEEQIQLLKEQNKILKQILQKTGSIDGRELSRMVSEYQMEDAMMGGY